MTLEQQYAIISDIILENIAKFTDEYDNTKTDLHIPKSVYKIINEYYAKYDKNTFINMSKSHCFTLFGIEVLSVSDEILDGWCQLFRVSYNWQYDSRIDGMLTFKIDLGNNNE